MERIGKVSVELSVAVKLMVDGVPASVQRPNTPGTTLSITDMVEILEALKDRVSYFQDLCEVRRFKYGVSMQNTWSDKAKVANRIKEQLEDFLTPTPDETETHQA